MSTRVFVGGLTYKTRERDVEKFFRKYGRIKEISMKNGYAFVEFDDYRDAEDAVYEMNGKDLNGDRVTIERARGTPRGRDRWRDTRFRGSPRRGGRDRERGERDRRDRDRDRGRERDREERSSRGREKYSGTHSKYRVIIQNLSSKCSWQDLKDLFRKAGEVTFADAHKEDNNEGVVEFANLEDMKTAIEKFDDTEVCGKRIRVIEVVREGRSRSPSVEPKRSASRSRSRSRQRSRSHSNAGDERARSRSRSNDRP